MQFFQLAFVGSKFRGETADSWKMEGRCCGAADIYGVTIGTRLGAGLYTKCGSFEQRKRAISKGIMAKKLRVGILFGGRSGEHEVSLLSAASVLGAIDREKFDV